MKKKSTFFIFFYIFLSPTILSQTEDSNYYYLKKLTFWGIDELKAKKNIDEYYNFTQAITNITNTTKTTKTTEPEDKLTSSQNKPEYFTIPTKEGASSYLVSQDILRLSLMDIEQFIYRLKISDIFTGEALGYKLTYVTDIDTGQNLVYQDIEALIQGSIPVSTKDIYRQKKFEVSINQRPNALGMTAKLLSWLVEEEIFRRAILLDREGMYDSMHILYLKDKKKRMTEYMPKRYRKAEHLYLRLIADFKRNFNKPSELVQVKTDVKLTLINMVNGQQINSVTMPWISLASENLNSKNMYNINKEENAATNPANFETNPANVKTNPSNLESNPSDFKAIPLDLKIGSQLLAALNEKTQLFNEFQRDLAIAKVYGNWLYLNAGRKRGYKIGDRLIINNAPANLARAHVVRFYGPNLQIKCPLTGMIINDGMIVFMREKLGDIQIGDKVEQDLTIYPVLPANIKNYL